MSQWLWYCLAGTGLFAFGLLSLLAHSHVVRRILALNVMGSGVFLIFVALAARAGEGADPVPHAMVLTGLVVSVSATAVGLSLGTRMSRSGSRPRSPGDAP